MAGLCWRPRLGDLARRDAGVAVKDTRATFEPAQRLAERIGTDLQKDVNQGSHIRTKAPMGLATDKTDYLTTSQARHSTRSPLVLVGVILPAACRWARALGTRAPRRASRTAGEPRANPSTSGARTLCTTRALGRRERKAHLRQNM